MNATALSKLKTLTKLVLITTIRNCIFKAPKYKNHQNNSSLSPDCNGNPALFSADCNGKRELQFQLQKDNSLQNKEIVRFFGNFKPTNFQIPEINSKLAFCKFQKND